MSQPERADDALVAQLAELGKMAVPVEDAPRAAYRRERMVRLLAGTMTEEAHRSRRSKAVGPWVLGAAAAAMLALGGVAAWDALRPSRGGAVASARAAEPAVGEARSISGEVSVRRNGSASNVRVGDVFSGGEVVTTGPQGLVQIGIASGHADLAASSELEIVSPTASERRLRLGAGTVDVDLPHKLEAGKHLVVETPDAEVLVVGTAFTVDVGRTSDAATTHVRVRRGTVWIMQGGKQRAVLSAGDDWSSPAGAARTPTAVSEPEARRAPLGRGPRSAHLARVPIDGARSARASESGTLAEENRLFQLGLSARNAGDSVGAAEAFAGLLGRFPRSVLREQALAEQFRALDRAGRSSAATVAARRYLASYPSGFARADAERVTSGLLGER